MDLSPNIISEKSIIVAKKDQQIVVKSPLEKIKNILIFDVLGRKITEKNSVGSNECFFDNLAINQQTLIIKTILENGQIITKKLVY